MAVRYSHQATLVKKCHSSHHAFDNPYCRWRPRTRQRYYLVEVCGYSVITAVDGPSAGYGWDVSSSNGYRYCHTTDEWLWTGSTRPSTPRIPPYQSFSGQKQDRNEFKVTSPEPISISPSHLRGNWGQRFAISRAIADNTVWVPLVLRRVYELSSTSRDSAWKLSLRSNNENEKF